MNPQRKTRIILALLVSSVFLLQNCATIGRGTSQEIPVTSNPSGAKIIVDEEEMGYTPLNLKLTRKKSHIIRIEKQGYNPFEIKITQKISASIISDILRHALISIVPSFLAVVYTIDDPDYEHNPFLPVLIGCTVGFTLVDFITGANFSLSPKELNVTLTKIEGRTQSNIIFINAEQFQNIKWIRIKCVDSDKEEIVNID